MTGPIAWPNQIVRALHTVTTEAEPAPARPARKTALHGLWTIEVTSFDTSLFDLERVRRILDDNPVPSSGRMFVPLEDSDGEDQKGAPL